MRCWLQIRGLWLCGCANHIYWSTTGIYWTQGTGDSTVTAISSIKYANGLWIGLGSGNLIASEDGKDWKKLTPNESVGGLVFAKGLWLGNKSGAGVWYSGAEQLLENGYFTD